MATTETVRQLLVGGERAASSSGAAFEVRQPFTGEVVPTVAAGTREDARRASDGVAGTRPFPF